MLFAIIMTLAVIAFAADLLHYYRQKRLRVHTNCALLVWVMVTDALPLVVAVGGIMAADNSPMVMAISMWSFLAWMVIVIPRITYYILNIIHLPKLGLLLAIAITACFVWGATLGRTTIRVERVAVCSNRLPASFEGFRIVQISDIHVGTLVSPQRELQAIVDSVNSLRPDLVVLTGDLVNIRHTELDAEAMTRLSSIKARYGVVSVLGNHDVGTYIRDTMTLPCEESRRLLIGKQQAMRWHVLEDSTLYIRHGGDSIAISGVDYDASIRKRRHDKRLPAPNFEQIYRGVPQGIFDVTLAHLPQLWDQIRAEGYADLTLSGHVHSMQLRINAFGWRWSPAAWIYDRWSGLYTEGKQHLYINDGTGYVAYPMRIGTHPEITLITLEVCE